MSHASSKKSQFKSNPLIDPVNGKAIKINSKRYNELIDKYGEPNKINSPKSKKLISVGKGEYKKLIKEGYTDNQLICLEPIVQKTNSNSPQMTIKEPNLLNTSQDIIFEYMFHMPYPDLLNFCQSNKDYNQLCQNNIIWNKLINRDFPFYFDDEPHARKSYEHWYNYFDLYVLRIISAFIMYRKSYDNLQNVYNNIFKLLVEYIMENNNAMNQETPEATNQYHDNYVLRISNNILRCYLYLFNLIIVFLKLNHEKLLVKKMINHYSQR